eukprot:6221529-Amphidinium_carterae.1
MECNTVHLSQCGKMQHINEKYAPSSTYHKQTLPLPPTFITESVPSTSGKTTSHQNNKALVVLSGTLLTSKNPTKVTRNVRLDELGCLRTAETEQIASVLYKKLQAGVTEDGLSKPPPQNNEYDK